MVTYVVIIYHVARLICSDLIYPGCPTFGALRWTGRYGNGYLPFTFSYRFGQPVAGYAFPARSPLDWLPHGCYVVPGYSLRVTATVVAGCWRFHIWLHSFLWLPTFTDHTHFTPRFFFPHYGWLRTTTLHTPLPRSHGLLRTIPVDLRLSPGSSRFPTLRCTLRLPGGHARLRSVTTLPTGWTLHHITHGRLQLRCWLFPTGILPVTRYGYLVGFYYPVPHTPRYHYVTLVTLDLRTCRDFGCYGCTLLWLIYLRLPHGGWLPGTALYDLTPAALCFPTRTPCDPRFPSYAIVRFSLAVVFCRCCYRCYDLILVTR